MSNRKSRWLIAFACASVVVEQTVHALPRTWVGGNADWLDGTGAANWSQTDEPDSDDEAIFNTGNSVNLGSGNTVAGLTLSGGIDLFTNNFTLNVDGLVHLSGAGTNFLIDASTGSVNADNVTINSNAVLELQGGSLALDEEVGSSLLNINALGTFAGNGTLSFLDTPAAVTTLLTNDGTLSALARGLTVLNPPPVGTLTISAANSNARVDLDGAGETGVVNVTRNQTLDLNVRMSDSFNGTMNLSHNATFDSSAVWTLAGGTINVSTGFVDNVFPIPDIAADTAYIKGSTLTQTGGVIRVATTDSTLSMDAPYVLTGGSLNFSGRVTFNNTATIGLATAFVPDSPLSVLEINSDFTVNDAVNNFNWDGPGAASTVLNGLGLLDITANQIDTGDNGYGGTLTLNDDADVLINVAANTWTLVGAINKNNLGTSVIAGDALTVSGIVNVNGGTLSLPVATLSSSAFVTTNGTLLLSGATYLAGPTTLNGSGFLRMVGTSTVSANTTINVSTFDWDGLGTGTTHTINNGVVFTINSSTLDTDGDMDDPINLGGNGAKLIMNGPASWTMNGIFNANSGAVGSATIGGSSRMNLAGTLNTAGVVILDAPVTLLTGSTMNIAAASTARLSSGNLANPNLMSAATIAGPGTLAANDTIGLQGSGTIGAPIDFDGTASLRADSGTLNITSTIVDVGTIGTANGSSTLNIASAWNSNVATNVQLNGGVLSGGTITVGNTSGITGNGLVTAPVINTTRIEANTGTLIIDNATSDWDGAGNTGSLIAAATRTLELRDNATFNYLGTVQVGSGGMVFANGFALNFGSTATLTMSSGTYSATSSTDFNGTITVNAGAASTIQVTNNFFTTFTPTSKTVLNSDLRLMNNNINIEAGATFSGTGAVIIPDGSHLVLDPNSIVNVLLVNQGAIRPGNFNGIGRADVKDFQQDDTGELFVEITGTALNQYDRLVVNGTAVLDGYLNIDIDGAFVPVLGNTFNIITATSLIGTFDYYDTSGMPAGLAYHINYLPNAVQLQVVNKPIFSADFDDDGDVDMTDYAIWKGAFNLNQLGDANGDNITDLSDFTIWSDQLGSMPGPLPGTYIPEPATGALAGLAALLGLRRRNRRKLGAGLLAGMLGMLTAILPSSNTTAAPTLSVLNNGVIAGKRNWVVQVSPDASLFTGGKGSVGVELAFEIEGTALDSATVNSASFPYDNPQNNNPFPGGSGFGIQVNLANNTVFIPVGSMPFMSGAPVTVATILTAPGRGVLCWGGHVISANNGTFTGSRIAQAGTNFNNFKGTLPVGSVAGDADVNGKVNTLDFNRIAGSFGQAGNKDWGDGDFNQDNTVNSLDFTAYVSNYGVSVPAPGALEGSVVPEPASLAGVALAMMLMLRRRESMD
jgi:hypothetical protein